MLLKTVVNVFTERIFFKYSRIIFFNFFAKYTVVFNPFNGQNKIADQDPQDPQDPHYV